MTKIFLSDDDVNKLKNININMPVKEIKKIIHSFQGVPFSILKQYISQKFMEDWSKNLNTIVDSIKVSECIFSNFSKTINTITESLSKESALFFPLVLLFSKNDIIDKFINLDFSIICKNKDKLRNLNIVHNETIKCIRANCFLAVVILVGALVEAMLMNHAMNNKEQYKKAYKICFPKKNQKQIKRWFLEELIQTSDFSTKKELIEIKNNRNLVHANKFNISDYSNIETKALISLFYFNVQFNKMKEQSIHK